MCRIAYTINLLMTMLKNVWAHMGNAFILGLNTHEDDKATLKHMTVNTYMPTHTGRHMYLETLLPITKFKSNLEKHYTRQVKPTVLVRDRTFKGSCSVIL